MQAVWPAFEIIFIAFDCVALIGEFPRLFIKFIDEALRIFDMTAIGEIRNIIAVAFDRIDFERFDPS